MKPVRILLLVLLLLVLLLPGSALAQTYLFSVDVGIRKRFLERRWHFFDRLRYLFTNNPIASPIEYVDLGLPNSNFVDSSIYADVDGVPITDISRSGFQAEGVGVALGLGANAIPPGQSGRVHAFIGVVNDVLYPDSEGDNYASAVFISDLFRILLCHRFDQYARHFSPASRRAAGRGALPFCSIRISKHSRSFPG